MMYYIPTLTLTEQDDYYRWFRAQQRLQALLAGGPLRQRDHHTRDEAIQEVQQLAILRPLCNLSRDEVARLVKRLYANFQ